MQLILTPLPTILSCSKRGSKASKMSSRMQLDEETGTPVLKNKWHRDENSEK